MSLSNDSKPANISFLTWQFPPYSPRGVSIIAWDLVTRLSSSHRKFHVFHPRSQTKNSSMGIEKNTVDIHSIPVFHQSGAHSFWEQHLEILSYGLGVVLRHQTVPPPTTIHGFDWPSILPLLTLKQLFQVPTILTFHNSEIFRKPHSHERIQELITLEEVGVLHSTFVTTVSSSLAKGLGSAKNLHIIPNGIDTSRFHPPENPPPPPTGRQTWRLGFVGRFVLEKDLRPLIEAVAILSGLFPIKVEIVGEGPLQETYADHIAQYRLHEIVEIRPPIPHLDLPEWLRSLHIAILPTSGETFGLTQAEALCCGVPTISGFSPSLELIPKDFAPALMLRENTVSEIVHALKSLMGNLPLWVTTQKAARSCGKYFGWSKPVQAYDQLYTLAQREAHTRPKEKHVLNHITPSTPSMAFKKTKLAETLLSISQVYSSLEKSTWEQLALAQYLALLESVIPKEIY